MHDGAARHAGLIIPTYSLFQTEIGYARAWVRLALERKSLSEYLRVLVSDAGLLKGMYKRYGFLRYSNISYQSYMTAPGSQKRGHVT